MGLVSCPALLKQGVPDGFSALCITLIVVLHSPYLMALKHETSRSLYQLMLLLAMRKKLFNPQISLWPLEFLVFSNRKEKYSLLCLCDPTY